VQNSEKNKGRGAENPEEKKNVNYAAKGEPLTHSIGETAKPAPPETSRRNVKALGMIETRGLVASIEASDAMVKAADVRLVGTAKIGSGLVSVMVRGDVGAVKAAVEAGTQAAAALGEVFATHVIPSPHPDIEKILPKIS
jgi:ethanolamine utilization microcompartment shell protein EutS